MADYGESARPVLAGNLVKLDPPLVSQPTLEFSPFAQAGGKKAEGFGNPRLGKGTCMGLELETPSQPLSLIAGGPPKGDHLFSQ